MGRESWLVEPQVYSGVVVVEKIEIRVIMGIMILLKVGWYSGRSVVIPELGGRFLAVYNDKMGLKMVFPV